MSSPENMPDAYIAEFLDLARSANITFEIVNDRLHMSMVKPDWAMWKPCRHLLDEIGHERIEAFLRREAEAHHTLDRWNAVSTQRLQRAAEAMRD